MHRGADPGPGAAGGIAYRRPLGQRLSKSATNGEGSVGRTVITFGTFDVFHVGHLRVLERARDR